MATTHVRAAMRKGLSDYLATQVDPEAVFSSSWPTPGKALGAKAVSVILAPTKAREHKFQPVALSQTAIDGDDVNALVLWSYGHTEIDFQIDVWAQHEVTRDALEADVEAALNRPPARTLGLSTTALDLAPGLVIELPDWYSTPAAFRFQSIPTLPESSRAVQAGDWRATWMGTGTAHLLRQIQGPLMKSLTVTFTGSGGTQSVVVP